jgi:hypothetical protein
MAIEKITRPTLYSGSYTPQIPLDYQAQNKLLEHGARGVNSVTLSTPWNNSDSAYQTPEVLSGSVIESNGILYQLTSNQAISESGLSPGRLHLCFNDIDQIFEFSSVIPQYSKKRHGWYCGSYRFTGHTYCWRAAGDWVKRWQSGLVSVGAADLNGFHNSGRYSDGINQYWGASSFYDNISPGLTNYAYGICRYQGNLYLIDSPPYGVSADSYVRKMNGYSTTQTSVLNLGITHIFGVCFVDGNMATIGDNDTSSFTTTVTDSFNISINAFGMGGGCCFTGDYLMVGFNYKVGTTILTRIQTYTKSTLTLVNDITISGHQIYGIAWDGEYLILVGYYIGAPTYGTVRIMDGISVDELSSFSVYGTTGAPNGIEVDPYGGLYVIGNSGATVYRMGQY